MSNYSFLLQIKNKLLFTYSSLLNVDWVNLQFCHLLPPPHMKLVEIFLVLDCIANQFIKESIIEFSKKYFLLLFFALRFTYIFLYGREHYWILGCGRIFCVSFFWKAKMGGGIDCFVCFLKFLFLPRAE